MCIRVRIFRGIVLTAATIVLMACASTQPKAVATMEPAAKPAGHQGYRFYMTQNGKRMTADDFDAWLKANGLRVQNGRVVRNIGGAKASKLASTAKSRPAVAARVSAPSKATVTAKASATAKASGTSKVVRTGKSKAKREETAVVTAVATHKDG